MTDRTPRTRGDIQHVVGYGWHQGVPRLNLFDGPPRELKGTLALRDTGERRCTGWWSHDHERRMPCRSGLPPTKPQCVECSRHEGFWRCMTCDGFSCPPLSPAINAYCKGDHVLYLASFGGPQVKIGTSVLARREARVVEQAPVAVAHIAQAPGPVIKQMEALGVQAGLTEHVQRNRKWHQWRQASSESDARRWVVEAAERLHEQLPTHYHPHLHAPRFVTLPPTLIPPNDLSPLTLLPTGPNTVVRGQVVGSRGHIVVLHDGAGRVALDIGALKGRLVDFAPEAGPAPVRQLGLFG